MAGDENRTICGLPDWVPIPNNETATFVNDVVLCAVSVPFCIFAFLANLAVILAVIKTPSLQRPSNILLCSLATTDCLTGLVAQPLFVAWRLMIHHIHESCDYQAELFKAYWVALAAFSGWSLANLTVMSFDRHFAVSKPLVYRAERTNTGALQTAFITGTTWLAWAVFVRFILSTADACVATKASGAALFTLPIVSYGRIFVAIRRHNKKTQDVVSGQNLSVILKREKRVAIDMFIVIAVLMLCLAPAVAVGVFQELLSKQVHGVLYVWSTFLLFINSSINPIIYMALNIEIRNAVRSTMSK